MFVLGLGVFIAPFAFPTPPPIVTRFKATRLFSPNADRTRDVARVAVTLNAPSFVDVEIRDLRDQRWKGLIAENHPVGIVRLSWDGTGDTGRPVPDGRYVVRLRARSGKKQWNASRTIIVDRAAPPIRDFDVASAALAGPGEGECRVTLTAGDRGILAIDVIAPGEPDQPVARFGPRPLGAAQPLSWSWDGARADGTPVAPGIYQVRATLADVPGNRSEQSAFCWAGHLIGQPVPARPALGDRIGVRLRTVAGAPIAPTTPVQLAIYRRTTRGPAPLGASFGSRASGPLGQVRLQLPRRVPPAQLWVVASTAEGRALIPLRP